MVGVSDILLNLAGQGQKWLKRGPNMENHGKQLFCLQLEASALLLTVDNFSFFSKKHLLLENLLRILLRSVRLHDSLGVHPTRGPCETS